MNREELAWAAGFFDGEGWVGVHTRRGRGDQLIIRVGQKDRVVLDRFQRAIGFGSVLGPYGPYRNTSYSMFIYQVGGFHTVQAACALLWTWLCPVKRQQFRTAMLRATAAAGPVAHIHQVVCLHGHPLSGENVKEYRTPQGHRKRVCVTCAREAMHHHYLFRRTAYAALAAT